MEKVKVYASSSSWIEGAAIQQLEQTAALPGMLTVAGMPDLHPGKGCAVGAVSHTEGIVYPHLIGNDIGCGYTMFQTSIPKAKASNPQRLADMLTGLDSEWDGDAEKHLSMCGVEPSHVNGLGTIGGGNHFAEIQQIMTIDLDPSEYHGSEISLIDPDYLVLLVHSGSRNLGELIFQKFAAICGNRGFEEGSDDFNAYMAAHDNAVKWANASRSLIAVRLLSCLESGGRQLIDLPHNLVERHEGGFLHRKGAAPSNRGISPLPGSRGTPTYLLEPLSNDGLVSLAHGAGRKSSRANMHGRVQESVKEMTTTPMGSVVVCGQENLMREEHHSAYKNVERVLTDLSDHGLAKSVATLHPVLTYKSERTKENKQNKREKEKDWRQERKEKNRRKL